MTTHSTFAIWCGALVIVATASGTTAVPSAAESNATLQGVWRTIEVVVSGAPARTFRPGATLAIFHGRHYSRVEVHAEEPLAPLTDPSSASADQLRATWGPFVGEAGTFEVKGNEIVMQATVSKNPSAMTKGAVSVYTFRRDGDTLTLTQVRTSGGPMANPITVKLTRVE
jgi:hypothetical protein